MQGKVVDMEALMNRNELTIAVGNAKLNARGDQLGPGGKILKKREEVVAPYYENNPKAVPKRTAETPLAPPNVNDTPEQTAVRTKGTK